MASNVIIRTEYTVRYAPAPERSSEEELSLVQAVIRQQGASRTLQIARALAVRAGREPDRPFLPVLWVEEEVTRLRTEELRQAAPATPAFTPADFDEDEPMEEEEPEPDDDPDESEDDL